MLEFRSSTNTTAPEGRRVLTKLYEVTDGEKLTHYLWLEFFEYTESRHQEVEKFVQNTLRALCEDSRVAPGLLLNSTSRRGVGKADILEKIDA